ncbi:MAG: endonuclease/exonuclease/phosphatase family protein [Planctomycetota bacterium]|jgi:endonuclease/exonuclease/phosphatase family metal-dependent hydrolase
MPGGCATVEGEIVPEVVSFGADDGGDSNSGEEILKVMTLNLGHGRGTGLLQEFIGDDETLKNLDRVALLLLREGVHVAAFQEADIKSWRSGDFNHVNYIAERAGYPQAVSGQHVNGLWFNHGTAMISKIQMSEPLSVAFDPVFLSPDKGFLFCTVGFGEKKIDVVSVHLDLANGLVRKKQAEKMVSILSQRGNPLVVMGDFNCELQDSKEVYQILNDGLGLSAYDIESDKLQTYPSSNRRLDWILISEELEFYSYNVLEEKASDHLIVVAELIFTSEDE